MRRRQLLQTLLLGPWCAPLKIGAGEAPQPRAAALPDLANRTASPPPRRIALDDCIQSVLIGLGPAGEALVRNRNAWPGPLAPDARLYCASGTDPAVRAAWTEAPPVRGDFVALAVDVRDPAAVAAIPFWAERLTAHSVLGAALILGDRERPLTCADVPPWMRAAETLSRHFDGAIEVSPGRAVLRAAAAGVLTDALLRLRSEFGGLDGRDLLEILRAGPTLRTAAAVWHRPERRAAAFARLWDGLQPVGARGALAFLHVGIPLSIHDLDWVAQQLEARMPADGLAAVALFPHGDWPPGRQVLGLTLAM